MSAEKGPIQVLIVDDMAQVRHDLLKVLLLLAEEAGIPLQVVGEAGDGQEAIYLARSLRPGVVLLDLAMPVLDGYAATQAIKSENPSIRVIALTVHGSQVFREKAYQAGADAFIEKGQPLEQLFQAIICEGSSS